MRLDPHYDHIDDQHAYLVRPVSDVDSAMGKGEGIGFYQRASLFPLALFKESLTKTVNWTHPVTVSGKVKKLFFHLSQRSGHSQVACQEIQVELHKIPNAAYVKIEQRHIARLFFPALYTPAMASSPDARKVPKAVLEEMFDIMRESICNLQPAEEGHWPPNYDTEMTRQTKVGKVPPGSSTYIIAEHLLGSWSKDVLRKVRARLWGSGAFWLDQFRGLRAANVTEGCDLPDNVDDLFERLNLRTVPGMLDYDQWRFDFATELRWDNRVLLWRKDAVPFIMGKLLLLSDADAEVVGETTAFHWDTAAQINEVGGFRYLPPVRDQDRSGIHYVQAYCTEKTLTYQVSKDSNSLGLTFLDVVKNGGDDYCTQVGKILSDAADSAAGWAARLEIRLSGHNFAAAQRLAFSDDEVQKILFAFDTKVWFRFKALRLFVLGDLLYRWFLGDDASIRAEPHAVHLVLACIWAINALNNRPKDMSSERTLAASLCPHQVDRARSVPVFDHYGIAFFAKLTFHLARNSGIPFLPLDTLEPEAMQRIAGNDIVVTGRGFEGTLRRPAQKRAPPPSSSSSGNHRSSKKSHTNNKVAAPELTQMPDGVENPFDLDNLGIAWSGRGSLQQKVFRIYLQFLADVVHKLPNPKGHVSYYRQDKAKMIGNYGGEIFKRVNVADVFNQCAFSPAQQNTWDNVVNSFWPESPPAKAGRNVQNWGQLNYRKTWFALCRELDEDDRDMVLKQVIDVCHSQLVWLPRTSIERVWTTKRNELKSGMVIHSDSGRFESACPHIALNPNLQGTFEPALVVDLSAW